MTTDAEAAREALVQQIAEVLSDAGDPFVTKALVRATVLPLVEAQVAPLREQARRLRREVERCHVEHVGPANARADAAESALRQVRELAERWEGDPTAFMALAARQLRAILGSARVGAADTQPAQPLPTSIHGGAWRARSSSADTQPEGAGERVCCGDHDEDGGRPCNGCPERMVELGCDSCGATPVVSIDSGGFRRCWQHGNGKCWWCHEPASGVSDSLLDGRPHASCLMPHCGGINPRKPPTPAAGGKVDTAPEADADRRLQISIEEGEYGRFHAIRRFLTADAAPPPAEGTSEAWEVHVTGPDDVLPAPSMLDAMMAAQQINAEAVRVTGLDSSPYLPMVWAIPRPADTAPEACRNSPAHHPQLICDLSRGHEGDHDDRCGYTWAPADPAPESGEG